MSARALYCGHDATFVADIWRIGNVNVIVANGPLHGHNNTLLERPARGATHHVKDFPEAGYWRPEKGIFVVPEKQCREIKP